MPKTYKGVNSRAEEARARKAAAKEAEEHRQRKELEDLYWQDDDKHVVRQRQRKEERETRRQRALEKKRENRKFLEAEQLKNQKIPPRMERPVQRRASSARMDSRTHLELPLVENMNRTVSEGMVEARSIEEAIAVLTVKEEVDKHPEKRLKAAYAAYEERRVREMREEFPNLRLSKIKQTVFKEWQKSPENPMNQD